MTGKIALMLELPILDKIHKYLENCETALISFSPSLHWLCQAAKCRQGREINFDTIDSRLINNQAFIKKKYGFGLFYWYCLDNVILFKV